MFQIWWWVHLVFILNLYVTANVWIYWDTKKNFTELHQIPSWLKMRRSEVCPAPDQHVTGGDLFTRSNFARGAVTESISVIDLEQNNQQLSSL